MWCQLLRGGGAVSRGVAGELRAASDATRYAGAHGGRGFDRAGTDAAHDIDSIVGAAMFGLVCCVHTEPDRARHAVCDAAWECMRKHAPDIATMFLCMAARSDPVPGSNPCVMPRMHDFVVTVRVAFETGDIQLATGRLPAWRSP